jgi:hypothetical protein
MRKLSLSKKTTAIVAAGILTVATAGGAYAYWTSQGSGTGSATTGTTTALTITQSGTVANLIPGGTAGALDVTASNSATFSQAIGNITATPTYPTGCDASNWTITPVTNGPTTVNASSTSDVIHVATVALIDLPSVNQNACKGASITFAFAG